jgi:predicted nucleic acid-binding protein
LAKDRTRWATIDTSPLCSLEHLGLFRPLTFLFDRIYIPRRVQTEYRVKRNSRTRLASVCEELAPYERCNEADEISIRLLLDEIRSTSQRLSRPRRHEGEAEAIIQAIQIGAPTVIVDEKTARKWALERNLQCRGTLWILEQLRERNLIGPLQPMLSILDKRGIRLPRTEVQQLLAKLDESTEVG